MGLLIIKWEIKNPPENKVGARTTESSEKGEMVIAVWNYKIWIRASIISIKHCFPMTKMMLQKYYRL